MIDLLEGIPGSGKSYEAVVYHVLPALKNGRKVVTNLTLNVDAFAKLDARYRDLLDIRKAPLPVLGRWDAEAANRNENCFVLGEFEAPEEVQNLGIVPTEFETFEHLGRPAMAAPKGTRLFGHVWDFYDDWRGKNNIGPLYIIDECHVSFPREKLRKKLFTPDDVIEWFKLHRHFGADVLLITQRMRSLEEEIAGLAQFHIKVHKAHFLGKPDEYIRKVLAGYRGGEVQVNERKYMPQYFPLYKSHTQGATVVESGARDLSTTYTKFQKFRKWFMLFSVLVVIWAVWVNFKPKPKSPEHVQRFQNALANTPPGQTLVDINPDGSPVTRANTPPVPQAQPMPVQPQAQTVPEQPPAKDKIEPLDGKTMHLVGWMHMPSKGTVYRVSVALGQRVFFDTTSADLEKAGYEFKPVAECMALVTWDGKTRPVTCDAPITNVGTESRPIVISDGANAKVATGAGAPGHAVPAAADDYPHPLTAAAKTAQLVKTGGL